MALLALPQISPPGMKKVGKRSMRCSRAESSKAFINIGPVGTNLPEYLENCQQKQSFVLALGDILKPEQVFVIYGGAALEAMSLIHRVDLCHGGFIAKNVEGGLNQPPSLFRVKAIYILWVNYPWEAANTYDFLQKVIYKMDDGNPNCKTTTPSSTISLRLTSLIFHHRVLGMEWCKKLAIDCKSFSGTGLINH
ncbi:uncharacterized protein LOC121412936 [Lytechinus variegatus]|uniref:uncharacterized protein LOC121412936 n=1 Tax=Lytechinus variegatus TaxID=7654 RepID=UPI001BB2A128|nr:uncharacterized protein LOC121412936 [Lytechinus variegatus]